MKSGRIERLAGRHCMPPIGKIPSWSPKNDRPASPSRNDGVETPEEREARQREVQLGVLAQRRDDPERDADEDPDESAVPMSGADASEPALHACPRRAARPIRL